VPLARRGMTEPQLARVTVPVATLYRKKFCVALTREGHVPKWWDEFSNP
jgi:hypothetical protein